jgi:hypothetical protein
VQRVFIGSAAVDKVPVAAATPIVPFAERVCVANASAKTATAPIATRAARATATVAFAVDGDSIGFVDQRRR